MYPFLHIGPIALSTYSLCFLAAYAVGGLVTYREAQRRNRATEELLQVALGALAGGMIGAKLSMLIFLGPATFIKDLPHLWYSGQAWTGGFFGGYAGVLIVKHWRHIIYRTGDIMPFCSYNTLHRLKYMTKTRDRAVRASRDGGAPVTQEEVTSAVQVD